jgi:hypothetical protein
VLTHNSRLPGPIDTAEKDDNRHQRVDDSECFERKEEILPEILDGKCERWKGVMPTPQSVHDQQRSGGQTKQDPIPRSTEGQAAAAGRESDQQSKIDRQD